MGGTPLHWAARNGKSDTAKLLLDHGARSSIVDNDGKLPVDRAYNEETKALLERATRMQKKSHGSRTKSASGPHSKTSRNGV